MKKIKKATKKSTKHGASQGLKILNTKGKVITAIVVASVLLLLSIVLMYMETGYGKLIIKNKSDLNLEYFDAKFVYMEGDITELMEIDKIEAHKTFTEELEPINLLGFEANYEMRFKFENHEELLVDAGYFNEKFSGNIKVEFKKTDDPKIIKMKIKASNGILTSGLIDCDEEYTIDLNQGKVLE